MWSVRMQRDHGGRIFLPPRFSAPGRRSARPPPSAARFLPSATRRWADFLPLDGRERRVFPMRRSSALILVSLVVGFAAACSSSSSNSTGNDSGGASSGGGGSGSNDSGNTGPSSGGSSSSSGGVPVGEGGI